MIVDIVVPTYNCGRWIDAFIESILAQTCQDWRIVTRDDGSVDNTVALMTSWKARLGKKLEIITTSPGKNLGSVGNYQAILAHTTAPWVMFGDHDDVWQGNRVSTALSCIQRLEAQFGADCPLVIATDAIVVDDEGRHINGSFWKWAGFSPDHVNDLNRIMVENPCLGPTMTVNRKAIEFALPMSSRALYQDWWFALVGCAFGHIEMLSDKTVYYRRHSTNESGVPLLSNRKLFLAHVWRVRRRLGILVHNISNQAKGFHDKFSDALAPEQIKIVDAVAGLRSPKWWRRKWGVLVCRLWFSSFIKNIAFFVLV